MKLNKLLGAGLGVLLAFMYSGVLFTISVGYQKSFVKSRTGKSRCRIRENVAYRKWCSSGR